MLTINLEWDSNALAAPQSFRNAVQQAANILEAAITDPITVNVVVGYGEFDAGGSEYTALNQGYSLGGTGPATTVQISYSALRAALAANETSATDAEAINSLPNATSLNGQTQFLLSGAQAKALGVIPATDPTVDGYIGFPTSFNTSNGLVTAAIVELAHAMGLLDGQFIESLVQYTSPGNHYFDSGNSNTPAYFSIDGGHTNLANFDVSFDSTLFLNQANDPLSLPNTAATTLTSLDLTMLGVVGFDSTSTPTLPSPNITPTATAAGTAPKVSVQNVVVAENSAIPVMSLITSVSAPSGDVIAYYGFYDQGGGTGYFTINGVVEPDNQWTYVLNSQLSTFQYVGGSSPGNDVLDVDAFDYTADEFTQTSRLTATTLASPTFFASQEALNAVFTPSGANLPAAVAGAFNLEIVTSPSGTSYSLPSGYQGVALLNTGSPETITLLIGTYGIVDNGGSHQIVAGPGDDSIGGAVHDTITGGSGNQFIDASLGNQSVTGGSAGNETIWGGAGDTINGGGAANETIGGVAFDTIIGGTGSEFFNATGGDQSITGGSAGAETVWSGAGDTINGGSGAAIIIGGVPGVTMVGGSAGNEFFDASQGHDSVIGGSGGNETIWGGAGDTIGGGGAANETIGGVANVTITGGTGTEFVNATSGGESIAGGSAGNETIWSGAGDVISGGTGATVRIGGVPNDTITGGSGSVFIDGSEGNQSITAGSGSDTVWGGAGDTIAGGSGHALIGLGAGPESIGDVGIMGGADTVSGFNQSAGDRIFFANESMPTITTVVATQTHANGNTTITFPDGSTLTLGGISHIDSSYFT